MPGLNRRVWLTTGDGWNRCRPFLGHPVAGLSGKGKENSVIGFL